ncbi:hypothetical protein E2C01_048012 [Portunus trituberculatus]|uniref:Uncharacterized protein n=1 Tax=Portunus trituberculatus TaxID=210409 RepID=A0A5B7G9E2_PORTR|nr:hypothetical protein [Portunus trituberculatus]
MERHTTSRNATTTTVNNRNLAPYAQLSKWYCCAARVTLNGHDIPVKTTLSLQLDHITPYTCFCISSFLC